MYTGQFFYKAEEITLETESYSSIKYKLVVQGLWVSTHVIRNSVFVKLTSYWLSGLLQ